MAPSWGHWFDFPALKRAYREGAQTTGTADSIAAIVNSALAMPAPVPAVGEPRLMMAGYLHDAWSLAQTQARAQGARLIVVYLPERRRFADPAYGEGPRPQVLAIARELGIPVVDGAALLQATDRPLDYFDVFYGSDALRLFAAAIRTVAAR
jgi:hypothetical protein